MDRSNCKISGAAAILFATATLSSCSQPHTRAEALRVADEFMSREDDRRTSRDVTIAKSNHGWAVTYLLRQGFAGGECTVLIDERSMSVVQRLCSQ